MGISQQPWQALTALPAWQLTQIPRPDGNPGHDTSAGQRFQALTSAYGGDEPLALAWLRDRPGGPVRVLAAGPALASGQHEDGQAVLTLPSGARGLPLPDGEAARMLAGLPCWTRITGVSDVLLAEDSLLDGQVPPSLEDGLLSAWLAEFGWLLLAEPVAEHTVAEMAVEAARAQMRAENEGSPRANSPSAAPPPATPNSGRQPPPGCGTSTCWPAPPPPKVPAASPGWSAPQPTCGGCRTHWPPAAPQHPSPTPSPPSLPAKRRSRLSR